MIFVNISSPKVSLFFHIHIILHIERFEKEMAVAWNTDNKKKEYTSI